MSIKLYQELIDTPLFFLASLSPKVWQLGMNNDQSMKNMTASAVDIMFDLLLLLLYPILLVISYVQLYIHFYSCQLNLFLF